jgi:hypothetical protein
LLLLLLLVVVVVVVVVLLSLFSVAKSQSAPTRATAFVVVAPPFSAFQ